MRQFKLEQTCKCIKDCDYECSRKILHFYAGREYQVDITSGFNNMDEIILNYKIYNTGGWIDYITLEQDAFDENFEIIK